MDLQIKKYADNRDLKSLKYIFVDALDVDPTFVRYEEEYSYCKAIPGLLEAHIELTPFVQDKSRWDEIYWTNLKMDLIKNFSDRRMMHMREVAQVFLAEKVQRIFAERSTSSVEAPTLSALPQGITPTKGAADARRVEPKPVQVSRAEQEKRDFEEAQRKLNEENRRTEAERQAKAKRIEQQKVMLEAEAQAQEKPAGGSSKKAIGIAVAAVVVAAVVLILLLK